MTPTRPAPSRNEGDGPDEEAGALDPDLLRALVEKGVYVFGPPPAAES